MKTKNAIVFPAGVESASEIQLIAAAQQGSEAAFAVLFDRYKRQVYSLSLRISRNSGHAEELTQQTFLKLFRNIASFGAESSFSGWVHRIAVNETLAYLRKKRSRQMPLRQGCVNVTDPKSQIQMKPAAEF
ncbi:MAG: RNA polymerase sigma factor [Terriglobia bacterium]